MARRGSVLIQNETANNSAQTLDVKKSVLDFERIERPLDEIDALAKRVNALRELQFSSQPGIAIFLHHTQHVAVKIALSARLYSRNRDAISHHAIAIVSAEGVPADFARCNEQAHRQQIDFVKSPNRFLQLDGFDKFLILSKFADLDHSFFAACQSASISATVASCRGFPRPCSTWPKRERNFALVRRKACSGSTFKKRAMLTITKSISPSSSSLWSCDEAACSSASSSFSLSKTWSTFSQSN